MSGGPPVVGRRLSKAPRTVNFLSQNFGNFPRLV
jgi:hypothetical protein